MNPRDIMTDAIHNFHPQYQQYTQYSSGNHDFLNNRHDEIPLFFLFFGPVLFAFCVF